MRSRIYNPFLSRKLTKDKLRELENVRHRASEVKVWLSHNNIASVVAAYIENPESYPCQLQGAHGSIEDFRAYINSLSKEQEVENIEPAKLTLPCEKPKIPELIFHDKDDEQIFNRICSIIERNIDDTTTLTPTTTREDLRMDSLDDIELLMWIEEEFDTEISDERWEKCWTIGSVLELVKEK